MSQDVLLFVTIGIISFLAGSIVTWQILRSIDQKPLWDTTQSQEIPRSAQATAPHHAQGAQQAVTRTPASRSRTGRQSSAPVGVLRIVRGAGAGQTYLIRPAATITLGRSDDADIKIDSDGVSRLHAQITHSTDPTTTNEFAIIDYSRNGTFVNDRPVNAVASLHEGDTIKVDSTVLQFLRVRRSRYQPASSATG